MSKRYFICYECGHKFETEEGQPPAEDPKDCPECHSANITVYAVRTFGQDQVPAGPAAGWDAPCEVYLKVAETGRAPILFPYSLSAHLPGRSLVN